MGGVEPRDKARRLWVPRLIESCGGGVFDHQKLRFVGVVWFLFIMFSGFLYHLDSPNKTIVVLH